MAKDPSGYSDTQGAHGDQRNKVHKGHTAEAKKRDLEQLLASYEILQEFSDYAAFKSSVIELGEGNNWVRKDGNLQELEGEEWLETMYHIAADNEWFHVRSQNKTKVYYRKRKMRDRETLSPNDKRHRPKTDLRRYTIDLRPDHSRAIQKLLAAGKKVEARDLVDKARDECIRLFERRYRRDVRAVGEHTDSGQLHFDLWHTGIREIEVHDSCADVIKGKVVNGRKKLIRERTEYKAYGVGVGVASWNRHRRALEDAGIKSDTILNRDTLETITKMSDLKKKDTKEPPRDIGMYESLDRFMALELSAVSDEIRESALSEYVDWLKKGYKAEKLGKRGLTKREKKMSAKIKQLKGLADDLRMEIHNANVEAGLLREALNQIQTFFMRVRKEKEVIAAIAKAQLANMLKMVLAQFQTIRIGKNVGKTAKKLPSKATAEKAATQDLESDKTLKSTTRSKPDGKSNKGDGEDYNDID